VRLVSPSKGDANIAPGGDATLLVVLEVVDVAGFGIDSDDSEVPRFLDDEPNVRLFLRNLIAKRHYTNSLNQDVIQLVSEIPVHKLVPEKGWLQTVPIDWKNLPREWRERGFAFPREATSEFAAFTFRVKDARGVPSEDTKPSFPTLAVGFASFAYVPQGSPPPESKPDNGEEPKTP
jgi:hypothetical protein